MGTAAEELSSWWVFLKILFTSSCSTMEAKCFKSADWCARVIYGSSSKNSILLLR